MLVLLLRIVHQAAVFKFSFKIPMRSRVSFIHCKKKCNSSFMKFNPFLAYSLKHNFAFIVGYNNNDFDDGAVQVWLMQIL